MSLLSAQQINTGYDKKQVLFDVSLDVEEGSTVLLIGSNGSGKSTLFKAIYGVVPIWNKEVRGKIVFDGMDITNVKSHFLIQKGIMYVPQKNELFQDMTVEKNLEISVLHLKNRKEIKSRVEEVFTQLDNLKGKRKQLVHKLSGGEQKILSLGMALANRPKLLMYDEPLAGLSSKNVNIVLNWLKKIKENGTTLVIIEHRIKELLSIADKVVGLKLGKRNKGSLKNLEQIKSFII